MCFQNIYRHLRFLSFHHYLPTAYGITTDDVTTYINASTCTLRYKATQPPIVFDYPIPEGHTKDEAISEIVSCGSETKREIIDDDDDNQKLGDDREEDDDSIIFE